MSGEKLNRTNKALIRWAEMAEEIEALKCEYEHKGWGMLVLHPGDVAPRPAEDNREPAFSLIVPDSELHELAELVSDHDDAYDEFEVHRAATEALEMFVVVMKATELGRAVCYPVYYDPALDVEFVDDLDKSDTISTNISNLGESQVFSFTHEKPSLFLK